MTKIDPPVVYPRRHWSRKSAIDLYGVDDKQHLCIFELKAKGNNGIGIVSEALCYAWIMRDLLRKKITFGKEAGGRDQISQEKITACKGVKVVLLAPEFHPLLDQERILALLNGKTQNLDVPIHFCSAELKLENGKPSEINIRK